MRKATQQPNNVHFYCAALLSEASVTRPVQEQVLFCLGADKPCKAAEVTLFTVVQSQIEFFFFLSALILQTQSARRCLINVFCLKGFCRTRMFL